MRLMLLALALAANTALLRAQTVAPIGVQNPSDPGLNGPLFQSGAPGRDPNYLVRVVPAVVVGLFSAGAFGYGATAVADCSDACIGVWIPIMYGATAGGILGSAAGAALPRGRGLCTGAQRFGLGVGGASLGGLVGLVLIKAYGPAGSLGMFVTVPVGSVMFMRRC